MSLLSELSIPKDIIRSRSIVNMPSLEYHRNMNNPRNYAFRRFRVNRHRFWRYSKVFIFEMHRSRYRRNNISLSYYKYINMEDPDDYGRCLSRDIFKAKRIHNTRRKYV